MPICQSIVTYHKAVAVGSDDSTFTACKQLTTIRHPGTTCYLRVSESMLHGNQITYKLQ